MGQKLFTPNPDRTFTRQVSFKVPTESGGSTQVALEVQYGSVPKKVLREMQDNTWSDDEVYEEVVRSVKGVGDAEGNELDGARGKQVMAAESAFVYEATVTFYDVMFGGNLKSKTSKGRRATG